MFKQNIFNELNPQENTILSQLSEKEILKILSLICKYKLVYRDKLNINEKYTFGFEIEFENLKTDKENFKNIIKNLNNDYNVVADLSLKNGIEVLTPISNNNIEFWKNLKCILLNCRKYGNIDSYSGSHIHIGADILENKANADNFITLWKTYEYIFFKFSYGELNYPRENINQYAMPLASDKDNISVKFNAINLSNIYSYHDFGINNTIEFRCPNGTLNEIIWQNNLNMFIKMIEYSKSKNFNINTCNKVLGLNTKNNFYTLDNYNNIYLQTALSLADEIFDNNLDKVYFLKQYIKDFKTKKNTKLTV